MRIRPRCCVWRWKYYGSERDLLRLWVNVSDTRRDGQIPPNRCGKTKKGPGIEPKQCSPHPGPLAEVRPQRFEECQQFVDTGTGRVPGQGGAVAQLFSQRPSIARVPCPGFDPRSTCPSVLWSGGKDWTQSLVPWTRAKSQPEWF